MSTWELASFNVGRLRAPLDDAASAEFVAALGPINQLAEVSDGFVWRLEDADGLSSIYVPAGDDPLHVINLSVWRDVAALRHFVYRSGHGAYLRRRTEWFEPTAEPILVHWWVPAGERPTPTDGWERLRRLRADGPGPAAFSFASHFPPPA